MRARLLVPKWVDSTARPRFRRMAGGLWGGKVSPLFLCSEEPGPCPPATVTVQMLPHVLRRRVDVQMASADK